MLIRSQCKKMLINMNMISKILESNNNIHIHSIDGFKLIGEYTSKEKALKVLDMIQQRYIDLELGKINNCQNKESAVFIMPQDSEVKD